MKKLAIGGVPGIIIVCSGFFQDSLGIKGYEIREDNKTDNVALVCSADVEVYVESGS